ncbi:family 16 glycoside hydrolase [Sediminibacterium sp.]|uniref:family 16 glycoside hydrolase n=1 Tax=Sediminibacterium sp. TaxID=1917865 RepID=UPI0025E11EF5|nr:family 16 glycoside hydrolase [Sediminibacterium sp.]
MTKGTYAQLIKLVEGNLVANKVYMSNVKFQGKSVVQVVKDSTIKEADEPTFVRVKNIDFKDGIIEVNVLSRLLPTAAPTDRGFIGLAFRINDNNSKFECIYIRPTNGRADNQLRRNHSIQYFSFPDYKFQRLRKESPEMYESYADMGLNEWTKMKIIVKGNQAKLFLNNNKQPSLIVNDLKLGADASGAIGFFVDVGTEGYFSDLKVTKHQQMKYLDK